MPGLSRRTFFWTVRSFALVALAGWDPGPPHRPNPPLRRTSSWTGPARLDLAQRIADRAVTSWAETPYLKPDAPVAVDGAAKATPARAAVVIKARYLPVNEVKHMLHGRPAGY